MADADWLIGIDEAGRGPLAGPVVAGACVLSSVVFDLETVLERSGLINDSKQLSEASREAQYAVLCDLREEGMLDFETALGTVEEIAELNILGATRLAMRRAAEALAGRAKSWSLPELAAAGPLFSDHRVRVIVDGRALKPFPMCTRGWLKGMPSPWRLRWRVSQPRWCVTVKCCAWPKSTRIMASMRTRATARGRTARHCWHMGPVRRTERCSYARFYRHPELLWVRWIEDFCRKRFTGTGILFASIPF